MLQRNKTIINMARKENMTKQKGSEKEILLQSENNVIVGRLPRR